MSVTVVSVNVGKLREVSAKSGLSGIYKEPVGGAVPVDAYGLEGDVIVDTKHHGGLDQAVYCYTTADYDWWLEQRHEPFLPGTFGENLTVSGISDAEIHIGDRFVSDGLTLEVTSPRIPCATFADRMGDPRFVAAFFKAQRPGFYCRVLKPGKVAAGDVFEHVPFSGEKVSLADMMAAEPFTGLDPATVARMLAVPLHTKAAAKLHELFG